MKSILVAFLLLSLPGAARADYLCRTSPPGAVTQYCASEAFVSQSLAGGLKVIQLKPQAFSGLAACTAGLEGSIAPVTDSTTATWGGTIAGSSTNHVLAYCDGTNWTVMGK